MKSKFCVMKYATLCPSPESSRPPPLHYTKGKGCRGTEGERDRRAISIHAPISTFPQADGSDGGDVPILPDPRRTDADGCAARLAEAIHASTEGCTVQRGREKAWMDGVTMNLAWIQLSVRMIPFRGDSLMKMNSKYWKGKPNLGPS